MTREERSIPGFAVLAIGLATFVSGAAALAYEVVWSRMLVVPLGNSGNAVTLVLCSFMLGMALGARFLGGLAERLRSPLTVYVAAELFLAAWALAMPFVVPLLANAGLDWMLRLAAGALVVLVPACAMGASMPVLVFALSSTAGDVRRFAGLFYGLNTVGAAAGAAAAGFAGAPSLGLASSSFVAAGASALAAVVVLAVSRLSLLGNAARGREEPAGEDGVPRWIARAALLVAAVGGFCMLGAEVLWARVLTFVFGHDTYAFAILLVVVLAGMGLGGLIYRLAARKEPRRVVFLASLLLGFTTLFSYIAAAKLVVSLGRDPLGLGEGGALATSLWVEIYRELTYAPILALAPSICAGALLPAACALYTGGAAGAGRRVGTVILVNGVFAAAGSAATSLLLLPLLGINGAFAALAFAALLCALSVYAITTGERLNRPLAALGALAQIAVFAVAAHAGRDLPMAMLQEAVGARHQEILHYEEGRTGTVSVTRNKVNGERQLFMNAVNEVTTRLVHDQSFALLGHLGPLLHPEPRKGMMICFGAGISAGAALAHPFDTLDVAELSDSVPRAAGFFEDVNNRALRDSRLTVHIEDGRQFLLRGSQLYDVIMVDSTHPKAVDSWILYTAEFYRLVRARLEEDGIAVQWVPLHGLSENEFKIIVRTFLEIFPEATMWVNVGVETYGQVAYVKLVGTKAPLEIDYKELALRLAEPKIREHLEPYGMADPIEILDTFLAGPTAIAAWTEGVPIQTDDRPFLAYITDQSRGRRMEPHLLLAVRSSVVSHLRRMGDEELAIVGRLEAAAEAQGFLLADRLERSAHEWPEGKKIALFEANSERTRGYYLALADLYRDDADKLFEIGSYLGNLGFREEAAELYERSLAIAPGDSRTLLNKALVLLDLSREEEAVAILTEIAREDSDNALARYNLGIAALRAGDTDQAISLLEQALALDDDLDGARLSLAEAHRRLRHLEKAEVLLRELTARARWMPEAWDMLGLVAAAKGDFELAKRQHARALELDPYDARAHYNMGIALTEQGRLDAAAAAYRAALRIEPRDAEAHNNLGLVYGTAGLYDKAAAEHRAALDIEPHYPEAAYNLGLAYQKMGLVLPAAEAFTLALELAPDLAPAKERLAELGIAGGEITLEETR